MAEVRIIVKIEVFPGKFDEFVEGSKELVAETRKEEGCKKYDVMTVDGNPNEFYLVEEWRSSEDLVLHTTTPHFTKWIPKFTEVVKMTMIKGAPFL
jgi:quinol monooxygenase YgiN